MPHSVITIIDF